MVWKTKKIKINREYFLYSVISKSGTYPKNVFKIYRDLCEKFGAPPNQIDYDTMWKNVINYLKKIHHYEIDSDEFDWLTKSFPSKKFSQIRGLKTLSYRSQKYPKQYVQKQIEHFIINSFSEMQLL